MAPPMPLTLPGSMKLARSRKVSFEFRVERERLHERTSVLVNLHSSEHGNVDPSGADHTEALVAAEGGSAGVEGDGLLAGIDEVRILLAGLGVCAHAQDTILRLQNHLDALGQESRGSKRHANA